MLFDSKDAIKIVSGCPVTRGSSGVMEFPPPLIATIAGAVLDKIEWMVLLLGERSDDGFNVKVTGFRVPQQRRTSGDVSMAEPMEGPGSTVGEDVVGVLHSHHSMGAFFSGTDNKELNPYFKSSIVVAQGKDAALGFKYKAEGKVTLPCGSIGKVEFKLAVAGSTRWAAEVVRGHIGDGGLGDCDRIIESTEETADEVVKKQSTPEPCNLICNVRTEKPAVYGCAGGEELLTEIRNMTTSYAFQSGHQGYAYERRTSVASNARPSDNWHDKHLSRKERKRLRREGKLSARREGIFSTGSSTSYSGNGLCGKFTLPAGEVWEHGMICATPGCMSTKYMHDNRPEIEGDDDSNFVAKLPHTYAPGTMTRFNLACELCTNFPQDGRLYWYLGDLTEFSAWMCDVCYDMCKEDAAEYNDGQPELAASFRKDVEELEMCRQFGHIHTLISGVLVCKTCAENAAGAMTEQEARSGTTERLGIAGLLPPAQIH